jgi:hypothetical protein
MQEYQVAGFPGCVGSTDCTHITTERCEYRFVICHGIGGKHIPAKMARLAESQLLE